MDSVASKDVELIGSPGIILDSPAHKIVDSAFSAGKNMRFGDNGAESLVGDLEVFSTASITPLWVGFFPPITAPRWAYANLSEVWAYEGTTHTEITRVSGDYNGSSTERWQSTVLNGVGVLNNVLDLPQAWTNFEPTTPLVDLPNWVATRRCKSLRSFKNFLVALYLIDSGTERPYRVLWSDSANTGALPTNWDSTDPASDSREFDLAETSDYLVDQLSMGDINIIYKEHSTWGMQYIGPPYYFRFWKILSKNGLLHRDCMANVPFGHVVVTQNDMLVHSGQIERAESIINAKLRRWLFGSIDTTNFRNSFLMSNPTKNEVYFCFPEVGETYATLAVVWNWQDKSIGIRELTPTPFGAVGPVGESIIDDLEWGV
jgi:hypothetical protein